MNLAFNEPQKHNFSIKSSIVFHNWEFTFKKKKYYLINLKLKSLITNTWELSANATKKYVNKNTHCIITITYSHVTQMHYLQNIFALFQFIF